MSMWILVWLKQIVSSVCSKGEQFVSKSVASISAGLEETKKTSAYQKMIAQKTEMDDKYVDTSKDVSVLG